MFAAKIKYYHPKFKEELGVYTCIIYDYDDFVDVMNKLVSDGFEGDVKVINVKHLSKLNKKNIKKNKFKGFDLCIK